MGDRPMFFSEFYFSSPPESGLTGGAIHFLPLQVNTANYRKWKG